MAQITISDILGSDAMSASRAVIMRNFKILADEANKIETYLNTSPVGGQLTIGNIKVTSTNVDNTVFNVQAGTQIDGRLEVGKDLQCNSNAEIIGSLTIGANESAITFNGSAGSSSLNIVDANAVKLNKSVYSALQSDNYQIDITGKSLIEMKYDLVGTPSMEYEYTLVGAEEGQVFVVLFTGDSNKGSFKFNGTTITVTGNETLNGSTATFIFHAYSGNTLEIIPLAHEGVNIEIS